MKGRRTVRTKRFRKRREEENEVEAMSAVNGEQTPENDAETADDDALTDVRTALPAIAIVGRPNVGKSSLFNAILKRRQAIVHFDSGVTRDRVSASGVFDNCRFTLFDTGGITQ